MSWVVQHYIPLAGGGTAFDPDPTVGQPGPVALDGASEAIPVTVSRPGGRVWADTILVDDDGAPIPAGAATWDVKVAKRTLTPFVAVGSSIPASRFAWNGGATAMGISAGAQVVQDQSESPVTFVAVVTGGENTPGAGRLAVRTWKDPR